MAESRKAAQPCRGALGVVLKGFPRMSEPFIASEIYRLERAGIPVRLLVIKSPDESDRHPVVGQIKATVEYLPPTSSVSQVSLVRWLAQHARPFAPALARTFARYPVRATRAAAVAAAQSFRARPGFWAPPRKVYVKEFFQAAALVDRLRTGPDVRHLHAHFCHGATTVAWLASQITGLPFSFTAHAKDVYAPALNPAQLLARKLRAARFAVTCTEAGRQFMRERAGCTPVHRVYHGLSVDFARLVASAPSLRAPAGTRLRVVAVGRLVAKKGFDVLLEACALLGSGVDWSAVIVGEDGGDGDELRRLVALRDLGERVTFAGQRSQADVFAEYCRATVFCLPCRIAPDGDRDGIPNVLVEAMACGLPVVTTDVSGIPEIVQDGYNGIVVPPENAGAVASALLRIQSDPAFAARLGERAAATVLANFDGDRLADELAAIFRPMLT